MKERCCTTYSTRFTKKNVLLGEGTNESELRKCEKRAELAVVHGDPVVVGPARALFVGEGACVLTHLHHLLHDRSGPRVVLPQSQLNTRRPLCFSSDPLLQAGVP